MLCPQVYYQSVSEIFASGRYQDAAKRAEALLDVYPDDGRLAQVYGTALWFLRDTAEATGVLEQATCLGPLYPLPQRALADCYAAIGKRALAVMMYQHLLRSGRCPTELLPGIAASLNKLGEFRLALRACVLLTRRNPAHHQAHFAKAYYLSRMGRPARRLIAPLSMAMDLAPNVLHYRLNLAFVRRQLGHAQSAHELIPSIAPKDIDHVPWLETMRAIHAEVGAESAAETCAVRIHDLRAQQIRL